MTRLPLFASKSADCFSNRHSLDSFAVYYDIPFRLAPKAEPEEDELIEEKKEDPCPDYDYDSENKNDP